MDTLMGKKISVKLSDEFFDAVAMISKVKNLEETELVTEALIESIRYEREGAIRKLERKWAIGKIAEPELRAMIGDEAADSIIYKNNARRALIKDMELLRFDVN